MHRYIIRITAAIGCAVTVGPWAPGRTATAQVRADHDSAHDSGRVDALEISAPLRNRLLAVALITPRGWSDRQWRCLDRLWTRESNWNHLARNRSSGAYGIPQALPATKMRSAGDDWRSSAATQIKWGLGYIARRYGTPCAAWGHAEAAGWY
ncbi:lytic transglycosylase domain-containing protein [Actinoallomurus iriomotensis]|uniref:aggregation-promoting factor C-terminal-like domain-containing protein n=1 Tax=Actinoallomurus iriomotensis TaxID=478107 RepID=UPI002553ACA2|nr:lytic transglycosylase domain-containing protein [Actinoallomurus iriomotensis]